MSNLQEEIKGQSSRTGKCLYMMPFKTQSENEWTSLSHTYTRTHTHTHTHRKTQPGCWKTFQHLCIEVIKLRSQSVFYSLDFFDQIWLSSVKPESLKPAVKSCSHYSSSSSRHLLTQEMKGRSSVWDSPVWTGGGGVLTVWCHRCESGVDCYLCDVTCVSLTCTMDRWGWSGWSAAPLFSPSSAIFWQAVWRRSSRRRFRSAGRSAVCESRRRTPPAAERWECESSDREDTVIIDHTDQV